MVIEAKMKQVTFMSKKRETKSGKSLNAVPFVMTYNPKLKSMNKFILKYWDLFYMGKEAKRMLTSKPMISKNCRIL